MIPNAKPAYDRADTQQLIETVKRLEKMLNALSAYVPQTDIDTGANKKLVIDAGVVTVVDP